MANYNMPQIHDLFYPKFMKILFYPLEYMKILVGPLINLIIQFAS